MKIINKLLLLLLLFISINAQSQDNQSFKTLNAKSLKCYNLAQWDSVIYYGKLAVKHDIEYFYLSYRLAVANFYTQNYFTASYYFDKATTQNKSAKTDKVFMNLYYKSLLYSKQYGVANLLFTKTDSLDKSIGIKHNGIVYLAGISGNNMGLFSEKELRMDKENLYSQTDYQQTVYSAIIGAKGQVSDKLELEVKYSFATISMLAAAENSLFFNIRNYSLQQNVVNVKPRINLNAKSSIDVLVGISNVKGKNYGAIDSTLVMDFINYKQNSIATALAYNYLYKNMRFGINAAFSNFMKKKHYQFGASLIWFPKGNLNLYSITEITAFKTEKEEFRPIIYQKIGSKLTKQLWGEVYGIYGDVRNFTMISQNYSFETTYNTNAIAGAKLIYLFNSKFNLTLGVQYVLSYTNKKQNILKKDDTFTKMNYQQFNIIGGLQWKF